MLSGFASNFASNFAGRAGYIAPMTAQAALMRGDAAAVVGSGVVIAGKRLIGAAGGVYRFGSPASAAVWIDRTRAAGEAELAVIASLSLARQEAWKAAKREKYARRVVQCIAAAARQVDSGKRLALIVEAETAAAKWH